MSLNSKKLYVTSVSNLLKCPLAKFITLAVNSYDYYGTSYSLFVNWVLQTYQCAACSAQRT